MARTTLQLGKAIDALRDPPGMTCASPSAVGARSEEPPDACQVALLWAYALLLTHGGQARRFTWRGDTDFSATSCHDSRRRKEVLAAIARACRASSRIRELVEELTRLLADTHLRVMGAHVRALAHADDPWAYLMENLWACVDAELRRTRGGYFTPQPIVDFIVRSVDRALRHELDVAGGLAAHEVPLRVVDPACGSGVFLLGVIDFLHARSVRDGDETDWRRLAREILPGRLAGIDVMPACCGAAEMLVEPRLGTCWSAHCGNILDDVAHARSLFADHVPIIIGNPPYANFGRRNRGSWIRTQLETYKAGLHEKKHNLQDDFIKFIRWGQHWIDQAGWGVLAMVTNNTYLQGLTHRQMRASLTATFDRIDVLDLHGNRKKREQTPAGVLDENVFPIQQGVAIGLFIKSRPGGLRGNRGRVRHAELWGSKREKLNVLAAADPAQMAWRELPRSGPCHYFVPEHKPEHDASENTYCQSPRLDEIFTQYISGVQTKCDALFVGFTRDELAQRMGAFLADAAQGRFPDDIPAWLARRTRGVCFASQYIRPYMVAPWDIRWIYYDPQLLGRARYGVLRYLDAGNVALVFMRQATPGAGYDHFLATSTLVSDRVFYNAHGAPFMAPLYTGPLNQRVTNLQPTYLHNLEVRLGTRWDETADGSRSFRSADVFHWMYALMHSTRYRTRYEPQLCCDFPRVPWPIDARSFHALGRVGKELVALHCRVAADAFPERNEALSLGQPAVTVMSGYPRWSPPDSLFLAPGQTWPEPLEEAVWQFRIGGYAVLPRWLKQRTRRVLTGDDQQYLQRMIEAIRATLQGGRAIDSML
ncbi:MAG: type ISP restriction/modification enzyme [Pirellulaceae bacterium]